MLHKSCHFSFLGSSPLGFFPLIPQSFSYCMSEDCTLLSKKLWFLEKCRGNNNCLVRLWGILRFTDSKIERPCPSIFTNYFCGNADWLRSLPQASTPNLLEPFSSRKSQQMTFFPISFQNQSKPLVSCRETIKWQSAGPGAHRGSLSTSGGWRSISTCCSWLPASLLLPRSAAWLNYWLYWSKCMTRWQRTFR